MPINKRKGERKNDFINRCIGEEVSSGKKPQQAAAICYTYWEELSLRELNKKRKLRKMEDFKMIEAFKNIKGEKFSDWGLTIEDLMNPKNQSGVVDDSEFNLNFADVPEGYFVRYKYVSEKPGHVAERPFCKMMTIDREGEWLSREDIEALNDAPGKADRAGGKPYSVFNWRGGNNCKHIWVRYFFNPDTGDFYTTPVQPVQKSTRPNG